MHTDIYSETVGFEDSPLAEVDAYDSLPYVELRTVIASDGATYLTRGEATALANALLWAAAEASD